MVTFGRILVVSVGLLAACSIASATDVTGAVAFVGITPCRIIDTRASQGFTGEYGPPALVAGVDRRTFQVTGTTTGTVTQCGIPDTAVAISANFTVTGFAGPGDIRVFPAGGVTPLTSILNYALENIANATSVPLGPSGSGHKGIAVHADGSGTDFIADVNGYYVPRLSTALESGQTLTGTFGADFHATVVGQTGIVALTFPIPLAVAPTAVAATNFIPVGAPPTVNCPGTSSNPAALPGNLCFYEAFSSNILLRCITGTSVLVCDTSSPWGVTLGIESATAGRTTSVGTWAVTAP
jgi:hypothetical protein